MSNITVNTAQWPIIIVTTIGEPSDAAFDHYLAQMTQLLQRGTRVGVIMDATKAKTTPRTQRKKQADWMKEHQEELKRFTAGMAFVFTSPVYRFILTGIFLIQSPPSPYCVVESLSEADAWIRKELGLPTR